MRYLVLTTALNRKCKNQSKFEMHLLYLSSEIYVAGHIFVRISIVLHKNKESKHLKTCISHIKDFT